MNKTLTLNEIPLGGGHATVVRWLVEPNATVEAGQPVAIFLGERAEFALAAEHAVTIASLDVAEGATASLGGTLATLAGATATPAPPRITPVARRIAREHAIESSELAGSGPGGRVLKRDVLALVAGQAAKSEERKAHSEAQRATDNGQLIQPSSFIRSNAPTLLTMMEADFGAVRAACQRSVGRRVSVEEPACVALVVAESLRKHPQLQAEWREAGFLVRKRVTLQVEQNGMHSVIPDAQDLNARGIARALATPSALQEATFRIRMLNSGDWAQSGVVPTLSVGAIAKRPVVLGEGQSEHIAIRPIARLTLHYDARVATPAEADRFLRAVVAGIERFAAE